MSPVRDAAKVGVSPTPAAFATRRQISPTETARPVPTLNASPHGLLRGSSEGENQRVHHIAHENEIPGLPAVAMNLGPLAAGRLSRKPGENAGIGRVGRLTRPVHVEKNAERWPAVPRCGDTGGRAAPRPVWSPRTRKGASRGRIPQSGARRRRRTRSRTRHTRERRRPLAGTRRAPRGFPRRSPEPQSPGPAPRAVPRRAPPGERPCPPRRERARTAAGLRMSPSHTSIRGFWEMRSRRPVEKSSRIRTRSPDPVRRSASAEPMKPAPPVINITSVESSGDGARPETPAGTNAALTAGGGTHVSAESGQFSRWGRAARLTRRVTEEPPPGELARVYFDRNATMSGAKRRGQAGMDRRPSPHRENWAAWIASQAVWPGWIAGRAPTGRTGPRGFHHRLFWRDGSPLEPPPGELGRVGFATGCQYPGMAPPGVSLPGGERCRSEGPHRETWPALLGSEPLVSRILFPGAVARGGVTVMHLARRLPDGSSDLPGSSGRRPSGASLFGLAPCGVYRALDIAAQAVRSYRTFSPLPLPGGRGGLFSVALSFRSPGLGVTQRTALRSSDFPPAPEGAGDRLNDSNRAEF